MKIRDIITEQQGVAQGTVPGAAPRGRGRPPGTGHPLDHIDNRDDGLPRIGRVEKTATGLKHHARPERGGVIPTADRLATLDKSTTNRLDQVFGVKWPKEKKKQGSIDLTALDSDQQTVAEGSGFDQEAGIGIDGKSFKFKIRDLVALANNYPVTKIDPQQFSKQIAGRDEDSTQSMARAEKADLQYPIIVVKRQNGQLWIADGTHRAHKAILNKLPSINAKIIPIKDMAPFDVEKGVAEGSEMDEALVHRGHVYKRDPDDVWHVRDDNTRKLRHHRGTVILAQARPQIYQDDAKASYTYTTDARGRRRRSLPAFHWAYIQGRMVKSLPQDISQGRKLWFKRGQGFVYADSQEPFASADYVAFNPDGSVVAYDSGQPAAAAGPVVSVEPVQQTVAEGSYDANPATFDLPRRPLNVPELIRRGAIFITHPHGEQGWETDRPNWDFSLITLQNVLEKNPPWVVDYKKYLSKDKKITQDFFNRLSDQKYNQILWSIKKLGIPDQVAFLDKQGVAEQRARPAKYQKGHTMKTMREYIDLVGETQPPTEAQAPLPGSDAVYTVVFYNAGDETYKTIAKVRSPEKALQIIKSKFNEMYDTGDRLRKVAPNIYVLEPDYENTGERATADNYDHMYHWVIKAAAA